MIDILWNLDINDTSKYIIVCGIFICTLFLLVSNAKRKDLYKNVVLDKNPTGKKSVNTNMNRSTNANKFGSVDIDKDYFNYAKKNNPSKCENTYVKCVEDNIKNKTNNYCYPCMSNGNAPNFAYNPDIKQWVKLS